MQVAPLRHEVVRLRRVRREVQVGEQDLAAPQHRALGGQRLLHLHDHLRLAEHRGRVGRDPRAGCLVVRVGHADAGAGAALYDDLVPVRDDLADIGGGEPHPVLADLDLAWHADEHGTSLGLQAPILPFQHAGST